MTPYALRPIRFLELWQPDTWRLKVYGIAYERAAPRAELIDAGKRIAERTLTNLADATDHYSVGFLGIHDGRTSNFVFIDWWAEVNELYHRVFVSPTDESANLIETTATGPTACVWDLRVISFERDAWLETVLRNPAGPNFDEYLLRRLNEDA
jgi:hypothetical protein